MEAHVFKHCVLLISLCVLTACSSLTNPFQTSGESSSAMSADESQSTAQAVQDVNTYYDFDDIIIPSELQLEEDESIVFESSSTKAGKLHFSGRIEPVSLFNFYTHHLPKDNWTITSQLKYGHFMIIAEKSAKFCVLTITESRLKTHLHIWVTPRMP